MAGFNLKKLSDVEQSDYKADGRMRAYLALKSAFKKRAKENGVTVKALADALDRDKGQISRVLSARSGITLDTIVLLTSALGFRLAFLPEAVEEMRPHNWSAEPATNLSAAPARSVVGSFFLAGSQLPKTSNVISTIIGQATK
jgi:transcriptional regulator with XRE-family HTH domain